MSSATNQSLKSRIWVSEGMDYTFPEQQLEAIKKKASVALCFSGGGDRAMTAAMGQLRALNHLNVLDKCRYLSCVSGGSWAGTIFTYYDKSHPEGPSNDTELLGRYTPTAKLTYKHLYRSFNSKLLAYGANTHLDYHFWFDYRHDAWIFEIGEIYLQNFGLFDYDDADEGRYPKLPYFSYDDKAVQTIKNNNHQLRPKKFHTVNANRPFLVINSCIPNPQKGDLDITKYVNFEYTPLTIGRAYKNQIDQRNYGGGFIEPFAFRGNYTSKISQDGTAERELKNTGWVNISGNDRPQTLADATGTSSSFFVQAADDIKRYDPRANYCPIEATEAVQGQPTYFGDGGLLENCGIIPMIQRGVELAVVFINTDTPLSRNYQPGDNPDGKTTSCDPYLISLFGYQNPHWKGRFINYDYPLNQVFYKKDFKGVLSAFKARQDLGQPLIVQSEHVTKENKHWGVKGGQKIKVVWCYLNKVKNWESRIKDKHVKAYTHKYDFPHYSTLSFHLYKKQIVLLSDFTCNVILEDPQQVLQKALQQAIGKAI